jgi:hypothetical protein
MLWLLLRVDGGKVHAMATTVGEMGLGGTPEVKMYPLRAWDRWNPIESGNLKGVGLLTSRNFADADGTQ